MALIRAGPGRSATLVALAVHYLLLASILPGLHICERHAHADPAVQARDANGALAVREHEADAAADDHANCVACQFTQLPKTFQVHAAFRSAAAPLRTATLLPRNDLPSSFQLLACVLPRGPPSQARA